MESLSRPFHSRKLSNATTFSNKNPYDTVFSGHRRNVDGPPLVDVQDYREIFSISQTSSIPVLDISSLIEQPDTLRFNFRESNPDYSKIFGGFRDEDVAVSYDKLFGLDKARVPLSRTPVSQDSDDLSDQSQDVLKQFSMSYNKISQKSKDGLDGANHVTQLPAVTGFTCFIDEAVMEGKKQSSSLVSEDTKSRRFDMGFKLHPSNVVNGKKDPKRSMNSEAFKTDFDEELDVNSAAFALRKAIENAQESIRIAKESVGRKNGLRGFSNKKFKKSLKLEGEEQKCRDEDEDEDSSRIFQGVGRNLKHGEKLFVAKKFLDEIHEKISESTKSSKFGDDLVVYNANASQVTSETESRFVGSGDKDESATLCSEEIESETSKIHVSDAFQTDNTFVDENESRILENDSVMEEQEVESRDSYNEASLSDADELVEELSNLNVSKKGEEFDQSDNQNRLNETPEDVLEHEDSERLEEVVEAFESVKSGETFDDFCESDTNDNAQTCENKLEESEVNLQDDCETKQEDLDQSSDLEFDLKSLDDDIITKETDDNNVGTSQDFDDVAEVSDEGEVKSEENNEKPEITNEVKDSQETECGNKEDETEEPGPSKVPGKERFKRINEEAVTKERERERNRIAVERAIREARERAFEEARERAERERAAVEKATKEVRQRMMAEAHEKVTKASVTNKPSDKTSVQSKLRAERAAVERATSEARQRALEKAISHKTAFDLNRSESALRTKAKLEKQNRIMERAAKALAEKEKRDRLAQKEQAERQRLAENLDADIKRWANGKEGNLRALLSTLQYILGPESGWQPVSLTEIISSSAVKKAYRKATLCVHPDKLQQRGATVQHKYICEKVFDLLKAAWNRFNSEER